MKKFGFIRLLSLWFMTFLIFNAGKGTSQEQPVRLEDLIQEVLQNNPQLKAARYQTDAAKAQIRQVKAWEPPQVGMEFYQTPIRSFPNPINKGMETDYFVQQMFSFPGKLSNMGRAAENNANMINQGYKALEKKIIRDLKTTYYELYHIQREIEINTENQNLMRRFVGIALKQYEVGMGKQVDILRAQTELSTLINEGINLQKERRVTESMINTILSRKVDTPLGSVPDVEVKIPQWTFEQLSALVLETRPELKSMTFNIAMNKSELALSKREFYPDFMGRVMYKDMKMTGNDFWSAMVGINVPLAFWSKGKYKGKVDENELNVKRAEEEYSNMKNMILFEVQDALIKMQTNQNLMQLYKNTVVLQAEQTLQSTIAAYQTGKTEFLMLIDAYRMLLMLKLDYHMAIVNYMVSQAALEQSIGINIEEISEKIH